MSENTTNDDNCDSQAEILPDHHAEEGRTFTCEQCNKYFKSKANLQQHKRIHTDERPFECVYCFKCFRHKGHLNEHMRIHTGEKPFHCNHCDKRFNRKGLLNQHLKMHRGQKCSDPTQGDQLMSDQGCVLALTTGAQSVTTDGRDEFFERIQGSELENQAQLWEEKTEATNVTEEPCREAIVELPTTVQSVMMPSDSTTADTCESHAGNVDEHERSGVQTFRCNKRGECFSQKGGLDKQKRSRAGEKRFECSQCGKCFRHKGNLNQHKITHSGVKAFKCNYCNRCFGHKGHLNEHQRIHTGERPFKCDQCNRRFSRAGILQQHKLTHTGEKPFNCTQCGRRFNRQGLLNQHLKAHVAEKRAAMVLLPSTIQRLIMAENHDLIENVRERQDGNIDQRERAGEPAFTSVTTNNKSCAQEEHEDRQRERTGREGKYFQCNRCNECFSHKWNLDEHSKAHTEEKPFGCDQCDKSFRNKGNLNQHKTIHTGEKAFKCNYCFKGFSHKGHLNEHRRIHTGEKPFSCEQCEKRFTRKSLLTQHGKTHARKNRDALCGTARPALICEKSGDTYQAGNVDKHEIEDKTALCSKQLIECCEQKENWNQHERPVTAGTSFERHQSGTSFNMKENLDERLISHEKTMKCNYCNKSFRHKGHLNEHKRIHTGEKPFKCALCEKRFNRKALVKQHHRTHLREKQRGIVLVPPVAQTDLVSVNGELCLTQGGNVNEHEATREQPRSKSFVEKEDLEQHKTRHTQDKKEKVLKCNYCNKCFGHKGHLNEHKRIHTGEKPYNCARCGKRFHRKSILSQHVKVHAREDSLKRAQSDQLSSNHGNKMTVTDTHTLPKSMRESHCDTGNLAQPLRDEREKYLNGNQSDWSNLEERDQQHKATDEGESFSHGQQSHKVESREGLLEKEANTVNATEDSCREVVVVLPSTVQTVTLADSSLNGDMFESQVGSEKERERSSGLKEDPENLSGTRTEECTLGLQTCVTEERDGDVSLVSAVQKPVMTAPSGELYQSQTRKVVEQRERGKELAFKSIDSKESFMQKGNQEQLEGTNNGENTFHCELCNAYFSHKWQLDGHDKSHTEERPFQCKQCGKSFRHKGSLYQHKTAHTGREKSFRCNYCNKSFGHKGHLNEHVRIHTGEKPFSCNQCGKRFNRKSILKTHQKIHTAEDV